jgi:hypothetical protein
MAGEQPTEELRKELVGWVRKEIGPIAAPDLIQFAPGLPKTRSGKIMRRILRKIAEDEFGNLGDTSTLADPAVVDDLVNNRQNKRTVCLIDEIRAFAPSDRDGVVALMRELQQFERQFIRRSRRSGPGVRRMVCRPPARHAARARWRVAGRDAGRRDVRLRRGLSSDDDSGVRGQIFLHRGAVRHRAPARATESDRASSPRWKTPRGRAALRTVVIGVLAKSTRVHGLYNRLGYHDHAIRLRKKLQSTRT